MPDLFDKYVDRSTKNPCDIEHIWANNFAPYVNQFTSEQEFQDWRNHVAGLLLLPADVNRSYQDKPFKDKAPHYAQHNLYAASLTASVYAHRPKFLAFKDAMSLPFKPYADYDKQAQMERRELVSALVSKVWSVDRLQEFLQ